MTGFIVFPVFSKVKGLFVSLRKRASSRRQTTGLPPVKVLPRVLAAFVVVVAAAIIPIFANDAIGYIPVLIVVCLIVCSFVYLQLIKRKVTFDQRASHYEWLRGEEGSATITLTNDSLLPIVGMEAIFVVEDDDGLDPSYLATKRSLSGHSKEEIGIDLSFDHVGMHQVGLARLQIFDLLGLFSYTTPCEERVKLSIVPRLYDLDRMRLSETLSSDAKRSAKSVLSDDMDYAYVREYEMGDPMKKVHWKLSARNGGQLFTKLFETHNNPGITVFLDFRSTETDPERLLDMFDTMLEGSFTLANQARKHGVDVSLVFRDRLGEITSTRSCTPEELDSLISEMPRLSERPNPEDAGMMLQDIASDVNSQTDFYVFTNDVSPYTIEVMSQLKREKRGAVVVAVVPPHLTDDERAEYLKPLSALAGASVPCVWIDDGADVWKVGDR